MRVVGNSDSLEIVERLVRFSPKIDQESVHNQAQIDEHREKSINIVEVRDSRTGYLLPARDGPGALPDGQSCWDAAVAAAAVSCQNVTLISFSFRA